MAKDDRVLIAGAGPVGTITGLYLAQHGVPVTLFDMLAAIPSDHRASTVHPSTLDMLAPLGVTGRIVPQGLISPVFLVVVHQAPLAQVLHTLKREGGLKR